MRTLIISAENIKKGLYMCVTCSSESGPESEEAYDN